MTPRPIPYGRQWLDEDDIQAVVSCLRGDWLTQGPRVEQFEQALCNASGARHAVAVSSGTAALHLSMLALGIGPGDAGIVPAITFAASANAVAYCGGRVVFADVSPDTALAGPREFERGIETLVRANQRPKVLVPVDMCGQPADLPGVRAVADKHGAWVVEDAAHSLGGSYEHAGQAYRAGCCAHAHAAILSFHPVKHITTAEGGAVLTNDAQLAARARELRTHGLHRVAARMERTGEGPWYYEQAGLGFNYRLSDLQCALGISQLAKLERFLARRREIAAAYDAALSAPPLNERLRALERAPGRQHAYHLYVVRVKGGPKEGLREIAERRLELYRFLREKDIMTQVHYVPVNWHPYYRRNQSTGFEDCPNANAYYAGCLSLPMYPLMSNDDVRRVVRAITEWAQR